MDPVLNPYAPGAGQRPPELAGREAELAAFRVVLDRVAAGRPERSVVMTGLRGVGKTVLLNALRGVAVRAGWGTGKFEARPGSSLRLPVAGALHLALRELHADAEGTRHALGVLKAFGRVAAPGGRAGAWQAGIDVPAVPGRADTGDMEIDLLELLTDVGGVAADSGRGIALFIDEMQDLSAPDVSALCAAAHELSQQRLPVIVVGAGLPHLPTVLAASKSYAERLFRYARLDRLDRPAADVALRNPARDEGVEFDPSALAALYELTGGYPYFVQAYGKVCWDVAPASPVTVADVQVAAPLAEAELAVGFFGARFERATPAEREYLRAVAAAGSDDPHSEVATARVAELLGRPAQSLSPARDALLKKGLVYSAQRGRIAFTVPHFGRYLLGQE